VYIYIYILLHASSLPSVISSSSLLLRADSSLRSYEKIECAVVSKLNCPDLIHTKVDYTKITISAGKNLLKLVYTYGCIFSIISTMRRSYRVLGRDINTINLSGPNTTASNVESCLPDIKLHVLCTITIIFYLSTLCHQTCHHYQNDFKFL